MRIFGWLWKLLRMLMRDEGGPGSGPGRNVARPNAYGNQRVRAGSLVRVTKGEWRGEEAVVDSVRTNGAMDITLKRTGRKIPIGTNGVEVLTRSSTPDQTAVRRGMDVRVKEGEWRGRVATVTRVDTNGKIWATISGGSTDQNSDPDSLRGKEIRVYANQVDLIGR